MIDPMVTLAATWYLFKEVGAGVATLKMRWEARQAERAELSALKAYLTNTNQAIIGDLPPRLPQFPSLGKSSIPPSEIPQDIVDFCEEESEEFAQRTCKERAAEKYIESGDWAVAWTTVAREFGEVK